MAVIKSGASSDQLTVDATSKAARVTQYDTNGNPIGIRKQTYRAATPSTLAAPGNATNPFFVIYGSDTKIVKVTRIWISTPTTTTLAFQSFRLFKYSTQPTGGTSTVLDKIPLDSTNDAATVAMLNAYTATPTLGTEVGCIHTVRSLNKSSTAVDGSEGLQFEINFGVHPETQPIILRTSSEGVGLVLGSATATSLAVSVEWTEEDA